MSPRDFLRIGKVQKEQEEPLTEAQVKHRDRSYIISKLNKSIQQMQGQELKDEKKRLSRAQYQGLSKEIAQAKPEEKKLDFMEKSDAASPAKAKVKARKGKELPSEVFLHSTSKERPITVGVEREQSDSALNMSYNQSFNMMK